MTAIQSDTESLMLIGGNLVESVSGERLVSVDPATEEEIGTVPAGNADDVAKAVEAASAAQQEWAAIDVWERGNLIRAVAQKMRERSDEILRTEVIDTGNTITKMAGDVENAARALDFYAGIGIELKGESVPATTDGLHVTVREPFGVVGRIVPFNHPIKFASHALAAPLMAGNAVVVKPPEQSPLSAGLLAKICQEVLPAGVVNIVTGYGAPAGDAIVRHPAIKRIAFTGSVPTGQAIAKAAAESGIKQVSFELGGKNPLIAFPDVDAETIADAAVRGMNFSWQGQSCGSTSRLLVHESMHDEVLSLIVDRVNQIKVGHPLDPTSGMGPVNSAKQHRHVLAMIEAAHADGARLVAGGGRPAGSEFDRGFWVQPTVFDGVTAHMRVAQQEVFGPVLSVLSWRTEEEAIEIANSTPFGLTASIWTNDFHAAIRAARAVQAGYVWLNGTSGHFYGTPFGGQKSSGVGREEGIEELLSYTESKTLHFFTRSAS